MAHFATPLKVTQVQARPVVWRLDTPLIYYSDILDGYVIVPEGFLSDFASVPRLPFAYLLAGGKADAAAVIHDYLYVTRTTTRAQADAVFREAIDALGYGWFTRNLMWLGVRLGGGFVWSDEGRDLSAHMDEAP